MKRYFIKQLLATLIAISMVVSVLCISVMGYETEKEISKIECNASVDDAFASNRLIIVFTQEASLAFKDYSIDSFPEIDCKSVLGLSTAIDSMAKQAISSVEKAITSKQTPIIDNKLNLSGFHTIISVELSTNSKSNVLESIEKLKERNDILLVCPDYEIKFVEDTYTYQSDGTGDTLYTDPEVINDLLGITAIHDLLRSRELSYESTPIVAVIDSGITHDSFGNRIVDHLSFDFSDFNGIYYPNDDLTEQEEELIGTPFDDKGHGTHVAGIIKSVVEYDEYINIQFSSIKVSEYDPTDNDGTHVSQVISAINYVNDLRIPIINISGSTQISPTQMDFSELFRIAVAGYQGLMICAAGNESQYLETEEEDDDLSNNDIYPAALIMDNLITVASCDLNGDKSTFSNWGNKNVDLFAPGENILSTYSISKCNDPHILCSTLNTSFNIHLDIDIDGDGEIDSGYHSMTGTSMSAPYVTGTAAMLMALNEDLTPYQIKDIIESTVDKYCSTLGAYCRTGGRLNVYNAVMELTEYCNHNNVVYVYNNSFSHEVRCSECMFSSFEGHRLCVQTIYGGDNGCNIACRDCSYNFDCDCDPEYGGGDSTGHYVDCPDGHFSFFEEHAFTYSKKTPKDVHTHNANCPDCGTTYSLAHNWETVIGGYLCTVCGETSIIVPGEMMSLPDDELALYLASLSDEELEAFLAALPEDQLARVTAILPPENDDELLTE